MAGLRLHPDHTPGVARACKVALEWAEDAEAEVSRQLDAVPAKAARAVKPAKTT